MIKRKVCWKITTKCNQGCKYCFGFNNIPDLSYSENEVVLKNLINSSINHITWTGGEAVLYPNVKDLMKKSKELGVYNKLVTNGIFLSKNNSDYSNDILENLDEINLSIDSIEDKINMALGKENNHFEIIKNLLEKLKDKNIRIGINTVVSKQNINKLEELGDFLNNYKIEKWKFLKFMPVREKALRNEKLFEITEKELIDRVKELKDFDNIKHIEYKKQSEFEKSIVVLPNADIIQTQNGKDYLLGNAFKQNIVDFDKINLSSKIKTFVAYNDINIINNIVKAIKSLNCAEIVGTAIDGEEAYNKIINLKPEMVFSKYNMEGMNGLEIIKSSKEKLESDIPIFNMIIDESIKEDEINKVYRIIGNKLNSLIETTDSIPDSVVNIMNEYAEYKNNSNK